MQKKIIILGSTGSIGKSTLEVINKNKPLFDIILLTANNNYKELVRQAIKFNVKNVLINNKKYYLKTKKLLRGSSVNVYSGDTSISKIVFEKVDFTMSAIVGLAGLQPTIDSICVSKIVALANKEAIICGWEILSKMKKAYNTEILPVDSEHFSIMELTKNSNDKKIKEIIITASGGPFLNITNKKLKKVKPKEATKHPNWKMGKKISVDSATLMNKVFEVIEAYKFFPFNKKKYKILIHPQSYVHSIVHFNNGLVKMILYNPDMKIPISNIILEKNFKFPKSKKLNAEFLNNMNFFEPNRKKFPAIQIIDKCLKFGPSTPIIVNASNEELVSLFLKGKIPFLDIVETINRIFKDKEFKKYAKRIVKSVNEIKIIDTWAREKINKLCIK